MKISTNSIGNYNPILTRPNQAVNKPAEPTKNEEVEITKEEKKFFTKLYPNNEDQINSYHFYDKDLAKKGVALGSLFDKRG